MSFSRCEFGNIVAFVLFKMVCWNGWEAVGSLGSQGGDRVLHGMHF